MPCLPQSEQLIINWQAPWLAHLPHVMPNIAHADDLIGALNQQVSTHTSGSGKPLHFIAQASLPAQTAYESHIFNTGGVPTRLNLHDFFNAAIWFTFPKTKATLNARQAQQIQTAGVQHARGMARDALTLFDENAAILVTSNPNIADALRNFDWHNALITPRTQWDNPHHPSAHAQAALYPFGHALLEKLIAPRKPMCAHTWILHVPAAWFVRTLFERLADIDLRLSAQLKDAQLNPRDFCPLPVLGVPHYCADNVDEIFYNDARVFRAGRTRLLNPIS